MKVNKYTYAFVSPKMKMADILSVHNNIIKLLPRFGIPLGFGDKTISEVCVDNKVSLPLFLQICNVYTQDDFVPDIHDLIQFPIFSLVQYLHACHLELLEQIFPHIEQHLSEVVVDWSEQYKTLITNFFVDYRREVVGHFQYEEKVVFPYIHGLIDPQSDKFDYKISYLKKHHNNIEDKLSDFTNLLVKYIPVNVAQRERVDMLIDIYALADDIEKHTLIEDKIMVPYIQYLENEEHYE